MVEQIIDGPDGLSNFDYVYPGHVIDLGTEGTISLIYFQNCLREDIRGGKITVRELRSDVHEPAELSRKAIGCGSMEALDAQGDGRTSAAMVFRAQGGIKVVEHSAPCFLIPAKADWFSIVEMRSALEIFRLQRPGKSVDLVAHDVNLTPGGAYQIRTNENAVVIRVSPYPKRGAEANIVVLGEDLTEKVSCGNP